MSTILLLLSLTFELNKFFYPSARSFVHYTATPRMLLLSLNVNIFRMNIKNIRDIFSYVCKDVCPCQDSDFLFLMSLLMLLFQVRYTHSNCQRLAVMRSTAVWSDVERKYQFSLLSCVYQKIEFSCRFCSSNLTRSRRFSMLGFIEISNNMIWHTIQPFPTAVMRTRYGVTSAISSRVVEKNVNDLTNDWVLIIKVENFVHSWHDSLQLEKAFFLLLFTILRSSNAAYIPMLSSVTRGALRKSIECHFSLLSAIYSFQ